MKILIGTKNPGKIEGARQAFEKYFENVEIEGISVDSNVGEQPINEEILQGAKNRVKKLDKKPSLVIIRVGEDFASGKYVANKIKRCEEVGIESKIIHLDENVSQEVVEETILKLNKDAVISESGFIGYSKKLINYLIEGPKNEKLKKIIPENIKLINIEKNNGILFKYDFPFLDSVEFENLFKSYKNNESFYKTRNNTFIDLTDKNIKDFLNMSIILDINNDNTGQIYISKDKSMYLFNKLKGLDIDVDGKDILNKLYDEFESIKRDNIESPKGLNANLRPYQLFGVKWLKNIAKLGFGGILADDMGLRKTIQLITFLLLEKEYKKKSLIVVPTSLIYNWIDELKNFAPSLKVKVAYGDIKGREKVLSSHEDYDVLLTTYGTLKIDYKFYKKEYFDYFIIDEAQAIKNPNAQITQCVKKINKIL